MYLLKVIMKIFQKKTENLAMCYFITINIERNDFYVWIYKPGNVDIEFFSWDLLHGVPGQSILNISNIEAYNG